MRVIAYDKFVKDRPLDYVEMVSFDDLLANSDFVSLHIPSSPDSYVIGANEIAKMKDGACLLYTSPSPRDLSTPRMPSSA